MNQSLYSSNLNALLPLENYLLILNEKTRLNKFIHSQNTIQIKQLDTEKTTRRKSCHCGQCGQQSLFQFQTMNIPLKKIEILKEEEYAPPGFITTNSESRTNTFYKKSSFKDLQICIPKENTNTTRFIIIIQISTLSECNTRLTLSIHGFQRAYNRQNTLLKMITDGQERSKRKETGSFSQSELYSYNSLNSLNSLNFATQSSLKNQKNSIQLKSPISLFSPKRKQQQKHNKLLSTNIELFIINKPYQDQQSLYSKLKQIIFDKAIKVLTFNLNFWMFVPKTKQESLIVLELISIFLINNQSQFITYTISENNRIQLQITVELYLLDMIIYLCRQH